MSDFIDRQAAIHEIHKQVWLAETAKSALVEKLSGLPSAQPQSTIGQVNDTVQSTNDYISRQAAIDALGTPHGILYPIRTIEELPSVEFTLYGYNVEHLDLIARVLQKEDIPPERVAEALTDIGKILRLVQDEFIETLRRAVQNAEGGTDEGSNQQTGGNQSY